ncbi:phage antirepressor protein [Pseudomonas marginalis]|uniref:phage antirepressor protein n=1 Tax=Pseudomonas marginalis TaxID=298 RepID=UPI002A35B839|nr:phage antirepressor protein [Pseudomonas marginalis]WPN21842.1 phage antirepressor protein [Pseudomonas marginalis]
MSSLVNQSHQRADAAPRFLQSQNVAREVSMTSLELVDFINGQRSLEDPMLDHADFMKKVPRVLKKDAGNFSDIYLDSMNRKQKCYRFPKRESCLMAMSYSYDLQAAVFDHMTALEERLSQKVVLPSYAEALRLYADQIEQTEVLRVENHQQAEKIASLESIFQVGMTPTQFSKRLNGVNCQQVNAALLERRWIFNSERDPKRSVKYRVSSQARDKYLTEKVTTISNEGVDPFPKYTPILLKEGAKRLHDLYMAHKLPMKKTWDGQFYHCKATEEDLS